MDDMIITILVLLVVVIVIVGGGIKVSVGDIFIGNNSNNKKK